MGALCSRSEEAARDKQLDDKLKADNNALKHQVRVLLLGAGESGKSTLFKQMQLLYSDKQDFTKEQRLQFQQHIHTNIIVDMTTLVDAVPTHAGFKSKEAEAAAADLLSWLEEKAKQKVKKTAPGQQPSKQYPFDKAFAETLKTIWKDEGVKQTWNDRGDIQVQDCLEYYMENIDRVGGFFDDNALPSNDDILRARVRTTGIVTSTFKMDNFKFEMIDVGGQRNERRKWVNAFKDVTAMLFVAAISEYNQLLFEDTNVKRLEESLKLFQDTINNATFEDMPIILFLNKKDLFREKLPKIPFKVSEGPDARNVDFEGPLCDPSKEYKIDGSDDEFELCFNAACKYMHEKFLDRVPAHKEKEVYVYDTDSTNTENIHHIMDSCKHIILKDKLYGAGWLEQDAPPRAPPASI